MIYLEHFHTAATAAATAAATVATQWRSIWSSSTMWLLLPLLPLLLFV